jgi:hypothetical protein
MLSVPVTFIVWVAVDHRERRRALFAEVDDRIGRECLDRRSELAVFGDIGDEQVDLAAGQALPGRNAAIDRRDRGQGVDVVGRVPMPPDQIIENPDFITERGEVQRRGPAAVPVAADHQHPFVCHSLL